MKDAKSKALKEMQGNKEAAKRFGLKSFGTMMKESRHARREEDKRAEAQTRANIEARKGTKMPAAGKPWKMGKI